MIEVQEIKSTTFKIFQPKIKLEMKAGRYLVKTITDTDELFEAFSLRYSVFQLETIGKSTFDTNNSRELGFDTDSYDLLADHIVIIDQHSKKIIATCRLNCSLFTKQFYSEQEFDCSSLINRSEVKLEVGRVCVHREHRKGIIILLLWRAIAEYMQNSESKIVFGCGSVMSVNSNEGAILYRYLKEEGKVLSDLNIQPNQKYRFLELEEKVKEHNGISLTHEERIFAKTLLPPLCKSYFDIGCTIPGLPAIDQEFNCIDFLTVLESDSLNPHVRQRLFGG